MTFPVLKTKRLVLRQLLTSDYNEVFLLRSNKEVNKLIDRKDCTSIEEAKAFIQTINEGVEKAGLLYWAIANDTNKLIGTICLFNLSDNVSKGEIGFELLPAYQGKGIMQEAASAVIQYGFGNLGLKLIEAHVHTANATSIKLLKKLNFIGDRKADDDFIVLTLASNDWQYNGVVL